MPEETWDTERIAELRRLAERWRDAQAAAVEEARLLMSRGGWSAPLDDAISKADAARDAVLHNFDGSDLLSLLDELESARASERRKNVELTLASLQLTEAREALGEAVDTCMLTNCITTYDLQRLSPAMLVKNARGFMECPRCHSSYGRG